MADRQMNWRLRHAGQARRLRFTNFENSRIRALLYAGRPNWRVLGLIVVR
jgi:hypothetical protein